MTAERSIRDRVAEVLIEHTHDFDTSDWMIDYGCKCGKKYSRTGLGFGDQPCHGEHAAHLADVLAAAGLLAEDRAGDHEWIDMTTFGDADRHEVCSGCGDTRTSART